MKEKNYKKTNSKKREFELINKMSISKNINEKLVKDNII